MDQEREVQIGNDARQILNNPLVVEALDSIEAATITKWESAASKDEREDYWRLYKVAKLFRAIFITHIETGELALEGIRQKSWLENAKEKFLG